MIIRRSSNLEFRPEIHSSSDTHSNAALGVAIGNFDGLHLGHQALLRALNSELAKQPCSSTTAAALSFYPHPRAALQGIKRAERKHQSDFWHTTSLRSKVTALPSYNISLLLLLHFTPELSALSPQAFVERIICKALKAKVVVVGNDWKFGKGRAGDVKLLTELGKELGFAVRVVDAVELDGRRVSSSWLKKAVVAGDMRLASKLLNRNFSLINRVVHGDKRGAQIGYPTANQRYVEQVLPKNGIYASFAHFQGRTLPAVTSVGVRPTFITAAIPERLVETYILEGMNHQLYGELLEVEFIERIRDELKFSSVEDLQAEIARDVDRTKQILNGTPVRV